MADRMVQCPECLGDEFMQPCDTCGTSGTIPDRRRVRRDINSFCCFCGAFHVPGQPHVKTFPEIDRRKPTANDRAVERILDAVDHARAVGLLISLEFLEDIIREEAANG